jgi:hypothetical protein
MLRTTVVLANILAASGAALCAIIHALSFSDATAGFWARLFAVTVLVVFPLGGLAMLLSLRVARTYGVWGGHLSAFIAQRAPKWLRRVGIAVFFYALIHLVPFGVFGVQKSIGATHVPLMASAFVAWFYLMFMEVFTVALRDPKIVEPRARRDEQTDA